MIRGEASTSTHPPIPVPDAASEDFWASIASRHLSIQRCNSCGRFRHPPGFRCASCGGESLAYEQVSGRATLHSYTTVHHPPGPSFVDRVPLLVGVLELAEQPGLLMITNLVGAEGTDLRVGQDMEVTFIHPSPGTTVPAFRPVLS